MNQLKRAWLISGFCVGSVATFAADLPEKAADERIVQMSPFEVSANSVAFKSWIKISSPHYLLYTDASEKDATAALRELELVHAVTQVFFHRRAMHLPPTIVVLPTSHSDWRKIENKGDVEWRAAVSDPAESLVNLVLVQYDWQSEGLWVVRAAQSRAIFRAMNLAGPFWFMRGMSKFFETVEIDSEGVKLGRQNSRTLALFHDGWMEWPKFFRLTEQSPEFRRESSVGQVEGQSAAFAHYMLANADPVWIDRFLDWSARLEAGGEPTEVEFKSVFGQDWKTWQVTMRDYLDGGRYQLHSLRVPKDAFQFPTTKFDLPVREMRELFVLAQILNQHVPASEQALVSLLTKDIQTESLRELLAEACFTRGRPEDGFKQLRQIVADESPNPMAYAALATEIALKHVPEVSVHYHFGADDIQETRQLGVSIDSRIDADGVREVRALCGKALALEPLFVPAINLLVWTEAIGPTIGPENLAAIEQRYRTLAGYVSTSDAVSAMGVAAWRNGDTAWARKIAQALAESPYADKDAKRIAAELSQKLDRASASAGSSAK